MPKSSKVRVALRELLAITKSEGRNADGAYDLRTFNQWNRAVGRAQKSLDKAARSGPLTPSDRAAISKTADKVQTSLSNGMRGILLSGE
jgi:hypothetical protein